MSFTFAQKFIFLILIDFTFTNSIYQVSGSILLKLSFWANLHCKMISYVYQNLSNRLLLHWSKKHSKKLHDWQFIKSYNLCAKDWQFPILFRCLEDSCRGCRVLQGPQVRTLLIAMTWNNMFSLKPLEAVIPMYHD
jgi:hypothetical protein